MTYLEFINKLRVELKDFARVRRVRFDGDGSTTLFELADIPIQDASYVVKVTDVVQTEVDDYTLDKDTGLLEFTSAPTAASDNIEITYKSVKVRDEDYLQLINDAIDHFRWIFWKMGTDTSSFTTVKDQYEYDLSSITDILYVIRAYYKDSATATVWKAVSMVTNWKYYTRLIKLYTDPPFDIDSLPMKLIYLKSLTKGATTSATLDIPTEWLLPFKFYVYARYYEMLIPEKIGDTSAVTTQPSFTPAQAIYNIAQAYRTLADETAKKLAPKLPPMPITQIHQGVII